MNVKFIKSKKFLFIILAIAILLVVISIIFSKKSYETINIGNNNLNKTLEEVEDYILNIKEYTATIEVTVNSNKNSNKYLIKQNHKEKNDEQEVLEPDTIKGVKLTYKDSSLIVENSNLNLEKINNEIILLNENKNEKINELNYLEKEIENKIKKELIINNLNTDNYNQIIYNEEIEEKINLINKEINEKELEEHKLELDKQNIFPKIDRLANIQEELEYSLEEYNELKNNSEIIDIAKEYLEKAYKNMKENVTPKFSKELSQTISNISDGKYKNMKITDNDIMVEVENGNYVSASQLSEGTIEQLYFSLRMAILKEISNETLPIFLDESFVFFDKNRLINTINYLNSNHDNQIIIFSCTEREKDILDYLNIKYNLITL